MAGEGDGDRRGDCEESDGHGLLEENYDVSRVSVREQAEARKGFCAVKPSSSCNCGVEAIGVGRSRIGNPLAGNLISELGEGERKREREKFIDNQ